MSTQEILSKNLKMELQLRGISQTKLAEMIGVKASSVNEWCNNKSMPSLDSFRKICIVLHADAEILLDLDNFQTTIPLLD